MARHARNENPAQPRTGGVHLRWGGNARIRPGDLIGLRVVDVAPSAADAPDSGSAPDEDSERSLYEQAKARYLLLRGKYEPDAT